MCVKSVQPVSQWKVVIALFGRERKKTIKKKNSSNWNLLVEFAFDYNIILINRLLGKVFAFVTHFRYSVLLGFLFVI